MQLEQIQTQTQIQKEATVTVLVLKTGEQIPGFMEKKSGVYTMHPLGEGYPTHKVPAENVRFWQEWPAGEYIKLLEEQQRQTRAEELGKKMEITR